MFKQWKLKAVFLVSSLLGAYMAVVAAVDSAACAAATGGVADPTVAGFFMRLFVALPK